MKRKDFETDGEYYKAVIKERGYTQAWTAKQMGLTREHFCSKLNGIGKAYMSDRDKRFLNSILGIGELPIVE